MWDVSNHYFFKYFFGPNFVTTMGEGDIALLLLELDSVPLVSVHYCHYKEL